MQLWQQLSEDCLDSVGRLDALLKTVAETNPELQQLAEARELLTLIENKFMDAGEPHSRDAQQDESPTGQRRKSRRLSERGRDADSPKGLIYNVGLMWSCLTNMIYIYIYTYICKVDMPICLPFLVHVRVTSSVALSSRLRRDLAALDARGHGNVQHRL